MSRSSSLRSSAVATLTLAAAIVLVAACGPTATAIRPTLPPRTLNPDGGIISPQRTPTSITSSGQPGTPATPPPAGVTQPITGFPQGDAYEVSAVTVTPTGYVAVGFAGTGEGYYGLHQGVVWTSADGLTWQQSVDPAFVDVDPTFVVAMGNDVYVFGYYSSCSDSNDECDLSATEGNVIFRSQSGGPWAQLAQTSDMLNAEIDGVRAWNDTLVAWGSAADDNVTTTLWTSKDALTWTPTTNIASLDPIDSVGVGGPGLVAFGSQYDDASGNVTLSAATSSDGVGFTAAVAPTVLDASVSDLVAGPGGMAGIGYVENDETPSAGLTVFSSDGSNWTQTMTGDPAFANTQFNDIHSSSSVYVAVGSTTDDSDFTLQNGNIYVSGDGRTWRTLGAFGGVFSQYGGSALGPSGLVLFTANEQDNEDGSDLNSTIYGWFLPAAQLTP